MFAEEVILLSLSPDEGSLDGGTTITISGYNIFDTGDLIICQFAADNSSKRTPGELTHNALNIFTIQDLIMEQ